MLLELLDLQLYVGICIVSLTEFISIIEFPLHQATSDLLAMLLACATRCTTVGYWLESWRHGDARYGVFQLVVLPQLCTTHSMLCVLVTIRHICGFLILRKFL
jgi:hypothetical protein